MTASTRSLACFVVLLGCDPQDVVAPDAEPDVTRRPLGKADGGVGFECSYGHNWINDDGLTVSDLLGRGDSIYATTYQTLSPPRPDAGGLTIIDAGDFTNPTPVAYHELGFNNRALRPLAVDVAGDVAYVLTLRSPWGGSDALYTIELDTGRRTRTQIVGGGDLTSVVADGEHAFIGTRYGVRVVWVRDPRDPREIATFDPGADIVSLALQGDAVYVGTAEHGVHIYDISDPRNAVRLGETVEFPATDVEIREDDLLFVMTNNPRDTEQNGFRVVDVSDPAAPATIGAAARPYFTLTDIEVRGDAVYLGRLHQHPLLYDVSDPSAPVFLHYIRTTLGSEIAVGDDFVGTFRPEGAAGNLGVALMTTDASCLEAELGTSEPDPGACGHDLCETGLSLERACDPCVAEVCGLDDFCCGNRWDSLCVDQAESMCGLSCR